MATFHASLRVLCRSKGESSVAAAAYRAGTKLHDARLGLNQDYTRRRGVVDVAVLAPPDAPLWATDLRTLWDAVEARETRVNSQLARELIVGLPHELDAGARSTLARDIAQVLVDRYRVAVQLAIHAPDRGGDQRNHHVHLLFTTRSIGAAGWGAKTRVFNDPKTGPGEVTWLREMAAKLTNAALADAGVAERVDHRTLAAQAADAEAKGDYLRAAQLTREPTRHLGRSATAQLRRGLNHHRAQANAATAETYQSLMATYLAQVERRRVALHTIRDLRGPRRPPRRAEVVPPPVAAVVRPVRRRRSATEGEEALLKSVHTTTGWVNALSELRAQRDVLAQKLTELNDPWVRQRLARLVEAHDDCTDAHEKAEEALGQLRQMRTLRRRAQRASDRHELRRPSGWRFRRRRTWEQERRTRFAKLREAIRAEREVEAGTPDSVRAALSARVKALRREVAEAEATLRRQSVEVSLRPPSQPQPGKSGAPAKPAVG